MSKIVHTIRLKNPLEIGGHWVEELEFREPTVAQILAADKAETGSYAEELELLSALCGVARVHLERLHLQDFSRCREVVQVVSLMIDHGLSWDEAQKLIAEARALLAEQSGGQGDLPGESLSSAAGESVQSI